MHHLRVWRFGIGGEHIFATGGEQGLRVRIGQQLRMLLFNLREVVFDFGQLAQQVTLGNQQVGVGQNQFVRRGDDVFGVVAVVVIGHENGGRENHRYLRIIGHDFSDDAYDLHIGQDADFDRVNDGILKQGARLIVHPVSVQRNHRL